MRIVFATAELSPVATVGGLAAAAAGLGAELRRRGVDVELVLPDYGNIVLEKETSTTIAAPEWVGHATLRVGTHADVGRLHLISVPGIARRTPYLQPSGHGWADNTERFFRFSAAVRGVHERRSARRVAPQRLAHGNGARRHRSGHSERAVDPQSRLSRNHRWVVAQAARAPRRTLRMVGRHEPVVGSDRPR